MRKMFWGGLALAAATGVLTWGAAQTTTAPADAESSALRTRLDALEGQLERLDRRVEESGPHVDGLLAQLDDLVRELETTDGEALAEAGPPSTSAAPPADSVAEDAPPIGDEEADPLRSLEERALLEPIDDGWASRAESELRGHYEALPVDGLSVRNALCKTTLCRMELQVGDDAQPEDAFQQIMHEAPWPSGGFVRVSDEGQIVLFISREGHELTAAGEG